MLLTEKIKQYKVYPAEYLYLPFKNALQPYIILIITSFFLYANTLNHEVAFDDESVLHKNEFVIKGVKGIKDILTHDSYYGYYKQIGLSSSLPGGRYRPLSHITFAIEQEFIGTLPDGIVQENSWDINQNGVKDQFEDVNGDGLYTDYDFWVRGSGFRHFVNVLLFVLIVVLVYHVFANYIFKDLKDMVFLSVMLFTVHPIHTEVIANIKSRDELLSLLFIFTTIYYSFKYFIAHQNKYLIYCFLSLLLALLSKEYAFVLLVIIPAIFFIKGQVNLSLKNKSLWIMVVFIIFSSFSLVKFFNSGTLIAVPFLYVIAGYYFSKKSKDKIVKIIYFLGVALIAYLSLRFAATVHQVYSNESFEKDIMGNPYLFASPSQVIASKIVVCLKYIGLFLLPFPLLADYSYKTIPYSDLSDISVWVCLIFYVSLIILAVYGFFKKKNWSISVLIFICFFAPVSNLFFDIGATMGERLIFHASLGLCFMLSYFVLYIIEFIVKEKNKIAFFLILIFGLPCIAFSLITLNRNPDWKNNNTLFTHDVKYAPNNINIILAAGVANYEWAMMPKNTENKISYLKKSLEYYNKGISIYDKHFPFYMNKAISFYFLNELDSSLKATNNVILLAPTLPNVYKFREKISDRFMLLGVQEFEKGDVKNGMKNLLKSVASNKSNDKAWNNLGKALLMAGAKDKALSCFQTALKINPSNKIAKESINSIQTSNEKQ
jgi:hypothetical protein